ncbi:MAG: hypothetical protein HC890_00315 [Chloroflexaceae bacterium]|nr:hypothetical protein [Chloroflexaceae bacterium]
MFNCPVFFLAGLAVLLGTDAALSQSIPQPLDPPLEATPSIQFSCVVEGGLPTTQARNPLTDRTLSVIRWQSQYFSNSGFDNTRRCQIVASRFQAAYDEGRLNYITAGVVNRLPVICATTNQDTCDSTNILFTLEPSHNPAQTLQDLFEVRHYSAPPLVRGGTPRYPYINVGEVLAPLGEQNWRSPNSQPNPAAQPASSSQVPVPKLNPWF